MRFEITEACVGCLACVRACPSQAIAVDGAVVRIVDESCIRSGACVLACPHDAVKATGDLDGALRLARGGRAVMVLSVEAEVWFHPRAPEQVVNACHAAGFRAVHRGITGDELVAQEYLRLFADPGWGTMIRSTCPVVVEKIRHDYPELVPYLAPVETPLAAEVTYLQARYGPDVEIVYAGVCAAEALDAVSAVVTFEELERLFAAQGVDPAREAPYFSRLPEVRQRFLSATGGLPLPVLDRERQTSRRFRKVRGLGSLGVLARAVTDGVDLGFVDLLPCEGCLDHPVLGAPEELFKRRRLAIEVEPPRSSGPVVAPDLTVDITRTFDVVLNGKRPPRAEIDGVLEKIGTAPGGEPWNCGACGFATCEAFAVSLLWGRAAFRQCPPYQERRAEEARRLAAVDELTGLATFRVLRDRMDQEVARALRRLEPFGVLFVDLDRFKQVNDTYGHEAGNQVLRAVAREVLRVVRQTDVAARYGGDEFVVILASSALDGVRHVGEVLRGSVERLGAQLGYPEGSVTVSVGGMSFDPTTPDATDPLAAADRALYRAKAAGGNLLVLWDEATAGTDGASQDGP